MLSKSWLDFIFFHGDLPGTKNVTPLSNNYTTDIISFLKIRKLKTIITSPLSFPDLTGP